MKVCFNFQHRYHKLAEPRFTTIRGKSHFPRLKVGQPVVLETLDGVREACIVGLRLRRLREIPIGFLKADAEYPGCTISTHEQFVHLLNSLRATTWSRATVDSEVTVITLEQEIGRDGEKQSSLPRPSPHAEGEGSDDPRGAPSFPGFVQASAR